MESLFNNVPNGKYFFSKEYVDPSRSPFIKESIKVLYAYEKLDDIVEKIVENKLAYNDFKVIYIKIEGGNIGYDERLRSLREIGLVVTGQSEMYNPKVTLGVTNFNGKWIFGIYEKNNFEWYKHDKKPYSYSNSLTLRMARSLVNIAAGNNIDCSIIDPCCGIGTVVIEALSMGFNIKGYEINKSIASNAKKNLEFLNLEQVITTGDMHTIEDEFDVSIVDIPYGIFTHTTLKEQTDIINTARRISRKSIIITFEDMEDLITSSRFKIVRKCILKKGNFIRYINLCE
ncbi:MAG: TRM11 family SAM-dependent methyltransferase [Clostridium sp.]